MEDIAKKETLPEEVTPEKKETTNSEELWNYHNMIASVEPEPKKKKTQAQITKQRNLKKTKANRRKQKASRKHNRGK